MYRTFSRMLNTFKTMSYFKSKKLLLLINVAFCLISSNQSSAQNFRILVTNDDGIDSPLLISLAQELNQLSEVDVVISAPQENQSGSSHSSIGSPLTVKQVDIEGVSAAYSVSGRPADAVRFGIVELGKEQRFDLVVSGINRGANVGDISHLSGTVGAAMEAVFQGVPAIAVSQEIFGADTGVATRFVAQLITRYIEQPTPEGVVVSINIPAGELLGVAVRPMGDSYIDTAAYELKDQNKGTHLYESNITRVQSDNRETDTFAYQQGYVTITPLKFDWTSYESLNQIRDWGLQLRN